MGRARRGSPSSGTALGEEDGSISATQVRSNDRERPRGWTVFHLPSTRARGVVTRNTVHPLAPRAPSARRRPRRRAAPSGVLTSAGRSCCCGWATPELCTSPLCEGAAPAAPQRRSPPPRHDRARHAICVFPLDAARRRVFEDAGCSHSIKAAIILPARVRAAWSSLLLLSRLRQGTRLFTNRVRNAGAGSYDGHRILAAPGVRRIYSFLHSVFSGLAVV